MTKTLKMLKNAKKQGDFTKGGWEMFERENIALRKKKNQSIKKIEAISIFFSFIEIIFKSLYCKPRNTRENYEIGSLELQKYFLRFNCALTQFLLNNLFDNFRSFTTRRFNIYLSKTCLPDLLSFSTRRFVILVRTLSLNSQNIAVF